MRVLCAIVLALFLAGIFGGLLAGCPSTGPRASTDSSESRRDPAPRKLHGARAAGVGAASDTAAAGEDVPLPPPPLQDHPAAKAKEADVTYWQAALLAVACLALGAWKPEWIRAIPGLIARRIHKWTAPKVPPTAPPDAPPSPTG